MILDHDALAHGNGTLATAARQLMPNLVACVIREYISKEHLI
jgi:hypothetical protein